MVVREKDPKIENSLKTIEQLNALLRKDKSKTVVKTFDQVISEAKNVEFVSTGIPELDAALGGKGLAQGIMVELFGPESSGKSYVTLKIIESFQRANKIAALIDAEQSADMMWLKTNGVDPSLLVYENDAISMEEHLQKIYDLCGRVDLIVVDSTAALVPRSEMEGQMGDIGVGAQARVLSQAVRKLMLAAKGSGKRDSKKTSIIWINQLRDKVGQSWGNPETTPGGKALKFYCHVRIDVRKAGFEKIKMGDDEIVVAMNSKGTVVKNKLSVPMGKFSFSISFKSDLNNPLVLLVQTAVKKKIFYKTKGEYKFATIEGEKVVTGATDFVALAKWMHSEALVLEVKERVIAAHEEDGEDVPDFVLNVDGDMLPPVGTSVEESQDSSEQSGSEVTQASVEPSEDGDESKE